MDSAITKTIFALTLISTLSLQAESRASCNSRRFTNNQALADNIASILTLTRFQAQFALGKTVTKTLDAPFVTGNARCSGSLSENQCKACLDAQIRDIGKTCRNAFEARVSGSKCSISYTTRK